MDVSKSTVFGFPSSMLHDLLESPTYKSKVSDTTMFEDIPVVGGEFEDFAFRSKPWVESGVGECENFVKYEFAPNKKY